MFFFGDGENEQLLNNLTIINTNLVDFGSKLVEPYGTFKRFIVI
jgi:hypothetical protein